MVWLLSRQMAYDKLKALNKARRAAAAAVAHGEMMLAKQDAFAEQLTAAKVARQAPCPIGSMPTDGVVASQVRLLVVGVSDAVPLTKSRFNGPTQELLLGELMGPIAGKLMVHAVSPHASSSASVSSRSPRIIPSHAWRVAEGKRDILVTCAFVIIYVCDDVRSRVGV